MKKLYFLGIFLFFMMTGCGQVKTSDGPQPVINEDTLPAVTDIPLPEKDLYPIETEKPRKKLLFRPNITWEDEFTFLYQYQEGNKTWFEIAKLQPDDTWEISTPEWSQKFVDLLEKSGSPLRSFEVCSDGSYFAMIQPEDGLPVFYHILLDGTITEEELPEGILQWTEFTHEIADGMLLTEKNEIVLTTTYKILPDQNTGESMAHIGHGTGNLIVYNPYTKKLVSKRECIDSADRTFIKGDYIFCQAGAQVNAYLLEGGGIQSIYTADELQKKREEELSTQEGAEPIPHEEQEYPINFLGYSGGNYAYWFTDLGVYRLDVSQVTNAKNTAEKILSSDVYSLPEKPVKLSMTGITCIENGKTTMIYTNGYCLEEKKVGDDAFVAVTHGPVLTRYIYREQ